MSKGDDFNVSDERSREQFAMVWKRDMDSDAVRGLSPSAFRVWVALCLYANAGRGQVYPRRRTVSDILGLSKRSVRRAITELEEAGMVKRHDTDPQRVTLLPAPSVGKDTVVRGEDTAVRGEDSPVRGGEDSPVPQQQTKTTDQEQQTSCQAAPDDWSQLRDHVAKRRPGATRWVKSKGNGAELAKVLKRTGSLERAMRLIDLAYESDQNPHPFNRERGGKGGHPPVATLARNGVRYLEEAEDYKPSKPKLRGAYEDLRTEQQKAEQHAALVAEHEAWLAEGNVDPFGD